MCVCAQEAILLPKNRQFVDGVDDKLFVSHQSSAHSVCGKKQANPFEIIIIKENSRACERTYDAEMCEKRFSHKL